MRERRVVVTGIGCLSPNGNGREAFADALRRGESGVDRISLFDPEGLPATIAGELKGFDPTAWISAKDIRHVSRAVPMAIAASSEALEDAGIDPAQLSLDERRGIGVVLGTGGGAIEFTDAQANALRSANSQFPLSFTRSPLTYSAQLSFPIFDRFQRERSIEEAELSRNDARYRLREQELRLTSDVTSAYRNLITQYQTVQFNVQNQQAAREALQLAQERYRVGATTFLDVTNAQTQLQTAATNYIISIYSFHKFFAALEAAVGRPLR